MFNARLELPPCSGLSVMIDARFLKEKEEYCPKFIKFIIRKLSGGCNVLIVTTTTDVICYFNSPSMGLAPGHILDVVETWCRNILPPHKPLAVLPFLLPKQGLPSQPKQAKCLRCAGHQVGAISWPDEHCSRHLGPRHLPTVLHGGKGMTLKLPYEKNVACESRTPNNFIITLRFPELHVFIEVNNGGIMNDIHYLLYNTQPLKVTTAIIFTSFLTYTHRAAQVCARYLLQISPPTSCQRKACCYPTEAHDSAGPFGGITITGSGSDDKASNAEHRPGSMVPPGKRVQTCNVVIWTGRRLQSAPEGGLRPGRDRSGGKDADVDAAPCAVCTVTLWTECQESWGFDLGASYQTVKPSMTALVLGFLYIRMLRHKRRCAGMYQKRQLTEMKVKEVSPGDNKENVIFLVTFLWPPGGPGFFPISFISNFVSLAGMQGTQGWD
ncbi:hypothetical protein MG293_011529 [Ovis ammon polii]|uniref:Uncharacterized protein n=1 Tax=Ovis ammon polii TaxID=230172 RepID=A0AAD4U437_OVIAM|nr:hypothetical protein MG293_011529 [Ovis ammon polii]